MRVNCTNPKLRANLLNWNFVQANSKVFSKYLSWGKICLFFQAQN